MSIVWNRNKTESGKIIGEHDDGCGIEDCMGTVHLVKWPNGETTECCSAGLDELENGDLKII